MQRKKTKISWVIVFASFVFITVIGLISFSFSMTKNILNRSSEFTSPEPLEELQFNPPSIDGLDPNDPMTELIVYGEELFSESNTVMPEYIGNELSCASCHADGGAAQQNSMVGVTPNFPEFNKRAGTMFTIEDRINGCMVRSMNGKVLEEDGEEMRAMVAYLDFLSEGIEEGEEIPWRNPSEMSEIPEPDIVHDEELYETKSCMSCHAIDGSGTGATTGPAVWGDQSFNDGAGMARLTKAAGYIQENMPIGQENTLTDQEAADLAAYILSQDRPEFDGHENDWPDGRPTDIMDRERVEQIQNDTFDWTEIENVISKNK